jgi:hypothetical protein
MREGDYSVWFRSPSGTGTARIRVRNGRITGGDAFIDYKGEYCFEGKRFEAIIRTERHTEGQPTWCGTDEVTIRVSGKSMGRVVAGIGIADQCPELPIEVTLMFIEQEETRQVDYSKVDLHPERLPTPGVIR